jgi:hypothetical protein
MASGWCAIRQRPTCRRSAKPTARFHGVEPSGLEWESYKAIARAIGNGGKILMIHSDAPAEARIAVKRGIEAMVKDPEYLKVAESVLEGYGFNIGEPKPTSPPSARWTRRPSPGYRTCSPATSA